MSRALALIKDPRERRFIELYVETNNATRSALASGYGNNLNSAAVISSRLLQRVKIRNAIDQRNAEIMAELDFTPDRIIREYAKIAGVNVADFVSIDADGKPHVDLNGVSRAKLAAVASVDSEVSEHGVRARIKTHDKLKALDALAKIARLFPAERTEISGPDGGPIAQAHLHINAPKIDLEALEPEQRAALKTALLAIKAREQQP